MTPIAFRFNEEQRSFPPENKLSGILLTSVENFDHDLRNLLTDAKQLIEEYGRIMHTEMVFPYRLDTIPECPEPGDGFKVLDTTGGYKALVFHPAIMGWNLQYSPNAARIEIPRVQYCYDGSSKYRITNVYGPGHFIEMESTPWLMAGQFVGDSDYVDALPRLDKDPICIYCGHSSYDQED